ncbi:Glycosyl hydrolase superfamily protein isoform 1 [Hibiscus syriacus]|uniref:Glycosyl hydrolase superfamily protein isoform 1 n=1 Tax=Hibiscus syriacus TaxID=106335 RepID=A0A6A2X207_HIBSY|nr:Glycosyl hydrolase superfamily protein isoform 1 [Hibiscus syriacus]
MEPLLLLASNKASIPTSFPLFLSCNSSFHGKPKLYKGFSSLGNLRKPHVPYEAVRAAVKRRKEVPFDNVIRRYKKLKLVLKIRKILVSQPDRIMSLRSLGRYRRDLGLEKRRRFIALLRCLKSWKRGLFIELRKLLMLSMEKRILLEKIAHLRTDLGLPLEFRDTNLSAAELADEENQARELEEKNLIIDRPLKFNRIKLPKGLNLSTGEMRRLCKFRGMIIRHPDMFYVSLKGDRDSVFLKEAYRDSQLIDKDPLNDMPEEASDEEGEEWSDMDSYLSDDGFGDAEGGKDIDDYEDDWSDGEDDDDAPPDFDEDDEPVNVGLGNRIKQGAFSAKKEENCVPVFPDGRPRERW